MGRTGVLAQLVGAEAYPKAISSPEETVEKHLRLEKQKALAITSLPIGTITTRGKWKWFGHHR